MVDSTAPERDGRNYLAMSPRFQLLLRNDAQLTSQ
jgi:hypothetical protein